MSFSIDKEVLRQKGISEEMITEQIECFKNGFPYLKLHAAASVENGGIKRLSQQDEEKYVAEWEKLKKDKKVVKFVPASGAASRMFKDLFAFLDNKNQTPVSDFEKDFFSNIHKFAFFYELNNICNKLYNKDVASLINENRHKDIVSALLNERGMNYGVLPKGVLTFHKYETNTRTPFEEHIAEGLEYAKDENGKIQLHFTISNEHRSLFEKVLNEKAELLASKDKMDISFSVQKPSTDTIAVDRDNNPFMENGKPLFRPGGHGALLENLNDIDADVIFIKNIDNVVPDRLKGDTTKYKKILGGVLLSLQKQTSNHLESITNSSCNENIINEVENFLNNELCCHTKHIKESMTSEEYKKFLAGKLRRPIRVCGMVKNVGEPGGGPFYAYNADGSISLQILESSQIDMSNEESKKMFNNGTHFNPVDLVCAVKDSEGRKIDLRKHTDKNTGFISSKSKGGKELKALELPGLWNGSMSDWNTVFVEVPLSTFNPVKTVNDLLREVHQ